MKRQKKVKENIVYFHSPVKDFGADFSTFEETPQSLSKKGLLLVEGTHVDNKKRKWEFPASRLEQIVKNTNAYFNAGNRIPLLRDHVKTQESVVGDLEDLVEARIITDEDLPNKRYTNLIGKLGIFANSVAVKATSVIDQVKQGLANTISPGIDMASDVIKEISLTPVPAIGGLSLFNREGSTNALTWEEVDAEEANMDEVKEEYEEYAEKLFKLLCNISTCNTEGLSEEDKLSYFNAALSGFASKLYDVFGVEAEPVEEKVEEDSDETAQVPLAMQPDGSLGIDPNASETRYSMYDTALEFDIDLAEFGMIKSVANQFRKVLNPVKDFAKKQAPQTYANAATKYKGIRSAGRRKWRKLKVASTKEWRKNKAGVIDYAKKNPIKTGAMAVGATGAAAVGLNALRPKQSKPWWSS
jgi:hypothetical protein